MMSDEPPVKRARSEMVNLGEHTSADEVVEEVDKLDIEVISLLRKTLIAKVSEVHRSVWALKEKKEEEERQIRQIRDLFIKQNIKEREDLKETVKQLNDELEKKKGKKGEFELTLKSMMAEVETSREEAEISATRKAEIATLNTEIFTQKAEIVRLKKAETTAAEIFYQLRGENERIKMESCEKDSLVDVLKNEILEKEYTAKDNLQTLEKDIAKKDEIVERLKVKIVGMQTLLKDQKAHQDSKIDDLNKKLRVAEFSAEENIQASIEKDITIRNFDEKLLDKEDLEKLLKVEVEAKEKLKEEVRENISFKGEVSQLVKTFKVMKEELSTRNTDLEKDNVKLQKLVNDNTQELNRVLSETKLAIDKLTAEVNVEKKKRVSNEVLVTEAERSFDSLNTTNKTLVEKEKEQEKIISKLQKDGDGWKSLLDKVHIKNKVLDKTKVDLTFKFDKVCEANNTLAKTKADLTLELEKAHEDFAKTNADLDKAREENEVLAKTKVDLTLELDKEARVVKQLQSEVDLHLLHDVQSKSESDSLRLELEKQKKRHLSNARITELQQSLDAKEEKVKVLLSEKEQCVDKLFDQTAQIIAIKKAVKTYIECVDRSVSDCFAHEREVVEHSYGRITSLVENSKKDREIQSKVENHAEIELQSKTESLSVTPLPKISMFQNLVTNFQSTFSSFVDSVDNFKSIEVESEPKVDSKLQADVESESDVGSQEEKLKLAEDEKHFDAADVLYQHNDRLTMVAKSHIRDMDSLMEEMEKNVSQLIVKTFDETESTLSRLQAEGESARNEFEGQLLEKEKAIASMVTIQEQAKIQNQKEMEELRKEFEEKDTEKELREKDLRIRNLLNKETQAKEAFTKMENDLGAKISEKEKWIENLCKTQAQTAERCSLDLMNLRTEIEGKHADELAALVNRNKTDMGMFKKATETEMNKKTLLVENLRADVEKHRSDLLNDIQTISRKDTEILKIQAELGSLKTDLGSMLIEKENLEKEISNVTETLKAEMRQTATENQSARTDLEAKVTEKEVQVQNLQVCKHLSFRVFP